MNEITTNFLAVFTEASVVMLLSSAITMAIVHAMRTNRRRKSVPKWHNTVTHTYAAAISAVWAAWLGRQFYGWSIGELTIVAAAAAPLCPTLIDIFIEWLGAGNAPGAAFGVWRRRWYRKLKVPYDRRGQVNAPTGTANKRDGTPAKDPAGDDTGQWTFWK